MKSALYSVLATLAISTASAGEISVREVGPNAYELMLTNETPLGEVEAKARVALAAASICKNLTPVMGRYRYESSEKIGGGTSGVETQPYRFDQQFACAPGVKAEESERRPLLKSAEESRKVQEDVRLKSEAYIRQIAEGLLDKAYSQVSAKDIGMDESAWKDRSRTFRETAGEPVRISIVKVTVYDNPAEVPEPGLYVAADYVNEFKNIPFHCGYLMWFRPPNGSFRITREEIGFVTAEQLKSMPAAQVLEIKQRLRCVAP